MAPVAPYPTPADSVAALVVELPVAVVRAARSMHDKGLVVSSLGNVSTRHVDGMIITPTRWAYSKLHVPDLVALGPDGQVTAGSRAPSSDWRVHRAIYDSRPDVHAIVHTHSVWATAWSWSGRPLDLPTEERSYLGIDEVRVAEHAPAGSAELAVAAVAALGDRSAVLLARHGVLTVGATPDEALELAEVVERDAQLATIIEQSGRGLYGSESVPAA